MHRCQLPETRQCERCDYNATLNIVGPQLSTQGFLKFYSEFFT